jgi:hypothetical protein
LIPTLSALSVAVAVLLVPPRVALASPDDEAARCVDDASVAQKLRDNGHLVEARALFVSCAADVCPGLVRRDCIQWLAQVDERLPTVVIAARGKDGKDLAGARVILDGKPVPPERLGRSFQLDPGPHTLQASHPGLPSRDESIVLAEREKGRSVVLVLETPTSSVTTADARPPRSIPVLSWVLGGVAVVGGAGFGVFWYQGMDEVSTLRSSCAPNCTADQIDDARTPLTIARISGGIAIAAAAGAVLAYFLSQGSASGSGNRNGKDGKLGTRTPARPPPRTFDLAF